MPLLDHFHPPLSQRRHLEGFHNGFTSAISDYLNKQVLPPNYVAEFQIHVGPRIEVDVGTFEYAAADGNGPNRGGTAATLPSTTWAPPAPLLQMPAVFPDSLEIQVFDTDGGTHLVAAIELISPANKDRAETRRALATKCAAYLQQEIGVVLVDIVTNGRANLHNELIDLLGTGGDYHMAPNVWLYAVAYRPVCGKDIERIDLWPAPLAVGERLPLLPLALGTVLCVPLDLEAAYMDACQRSRLV
jgi:hypothetical protein